MDNFKISNFLEQNPNIDFPWYRSLSEEECKVIRDSISSRFEIVKTSDLLEFSIAVNALAQFVEGVNAEKEGFSFKSVLLGLKIDPKENINVNWYRWDKIDELRLEEFDRNFHFYWFPGPDDIDIFDRSLSWILSIDHDGFIKVKK